MTAIKRGGKITSGRQIQSMQILLACPTQLVNFKARYSSLDPDGLLQLQFLQKLFMYEFLLKVGDLRRLNISSVSAEAGW